MNMELLESKSSMLNGGVHNDNVRLAGAGGWLVLIFCERKVLLAGW